MRTALLTLAVAAAACGSDSKLPSGDAVAGKVLSVAGQVTAKSGDKPARALAVDGQVYADDAITIAEGAELAVEFAHNRVVWRRASAGKVQVATLAAFKADSKAKGNFGRTDEQRTVAAGKPGEREAADDSMAHQGQTHAKQETVRKLTDDQPKPPGGKVAGNEVGGLGMKGSGKGGGGSGSGTVGLGGVGTIGHGSGTGTGYGKGGGKTGGPRNADDMPRVKIGKPDVDGGGELLRHVVQRRLRASSSRLRRCFAKGAAGVTAKLTIEVAKSGRMRVRKADIEPTAQAKKVGGCLTDAIGELSVNKQTKRELVRVTLKSAK